LTAVSLTLLANAAPAGAEVPYQDYKAKSCSHALCTIDFAPPPAGKRLVITSASCRFVTSGSAKIIEAELDLVDTAGHIVLQDFMAPSLVSAGTVVGNVYQANHTTLIYVPPTIFHIRGRLSISQNNGEAITCKITGTVETP
jgi:hypothetical protein